jgi:outer membrane protein OmpA-like peptidoglycan-associated protein
MNLMSSSSNLSSTFSSFSGSLNGGAATDGLVQTGSSLVNRLLGDRASGVASLIAETAGIRPTSASSLMSLIAPVLFGGLQRQMSTGGLTAADLPVLLSSHRDDVLQSIPAGLANRLGVSSNTALCGAPAPVAHPVVVREAKRASPLRWVLPLAALLAGFFLWRAFHRPLQASVRLPCGTTLSAQQGTFLYNLGSFMVRGSASDVPKRFVFDHLNFDSSTTQLTPESGATVSEVAKIMMCYPNMTVELDGHTDNTGDPQSNQTLSVDRANQVKQMLINDGIDSGRIVTNGFGQDRPITSNDTEDGRARNRRTELVVTRIN